MRWTSWPSSSITPLARPFLAGLSFPETPRRYSSRPQRGEPARAFNPICRTDAKGAAQRKE